MKKKAVLLVMALLLVVVITACKDRPDASLLPTPEFEFRVIKGLDGAEIKIVTLNNEDVLHGLTYGTYVTYTVTDELGNVVYDYTEISHYDKTITATIAGIETGTVLTCTVTYDYYGHTTSATVTDAVV